MAIALSAVVDHSKLTAGLEAAAKYTRRSLAQMVNTAACEVAIGAKNGMPFVPMGRIDAELAVITVPRIGKRGKPLKTKSNYAGGMSATQRNNSAPLAVLIIQARSNRLSRYSFLTAGRYYSGRSPFYGVSRAQGAAAIAAAVSRMIKARHSSTHFLMSGWLPAIKRLLPLSANKWRRRSAGPPLDGHPFDESLGDATPAREGGFAVIAVIENLVGMDGKNAASFNMALIKYGTEPLQRAMDNEGARNLEYALSKMGGDLKQITDSTWK